MPVLNVYSLPSLVAPEDLDGAVAVMIDVLRASTTIVHALEAGAAEVIPCLEVEDARRVAAELPPGQAVLGGERMALPIDGFDLGNSPAEYTPSSVGGKRVVITTTNGTRALLACRAARRVLVGAFVNATAVCRQLLAEEKACLVCAGTRGQYGFDDTLLAGLLVDWLQRHSGLIYQCNAQALTARENWLHAFPPNGPEMPEPERLAAQLQKSPHGQNLAAIGLEADILDAARIDRYAIVPELDPVRLCIQ